MNSTWNLRTVDHQCLKVIKSSGRKQCAIGGRGPDSEFSFWFFIGLCCGPLSFAGTFGWVDQAFTSQITQSAGACCGQAMESRPIKIITGDWWQGVLPDDSRCWQIEQLQQADEGQAACERPPSEQIRLKMKLRASHGCKAAVVRFGARCYWQGRRGAEHHDGYETAMTRRSAGAAPTCSREERRVVTRRAHFFSECGWFCGIDEQVRETWPLLQGECTAEDAQCSRIGAPRRSSSRSLL